ncbi:MAG TPA: hypothetical protein VGQ33_12550, partial [Vicinamibacteria bacterium]|nr:hypothetical protein [Vicinamibacteria bacterium]
FAQVGTCAVPCLQRTSEEDYRALAARAAEALAGTSPRPPDWAACVPSWIGPIATARGLVADRDGDSVELYPVVSGAVVEEGMATAGSASLEDAVRALGWSAPHEPRDDTPWLLPWLHGKRTGLYLDVPPGESPEVTSARLQP